MNYLLILKFLFFYALIGRMLLLYGRHFNTECGIFHCDSWSIRSYFIESQWNMLYPVWKCLPYFLYHIHVIYDWFSNIFPHKKMLHFLQPVRSNLGQETLRVHTPNSISYTYVCYMGVGKSLISSLSHIQSLQFKFYVADESQVFKIMLEKLVWVQLVFLVI